MVIHKYPCGCILYIYILYHWYYIDMLKQAARKTYTFTHKYTGGCILLIAISYVLYHQVGLQSSFVICWVLYPPIVQNMSMWVYGEEYFSYHPSVPLWDGMWSLHSSIRECPTASELWEVINYHHLTIYRIHSGYLDSLHNLPSWRLSVPTSFVHYWIGCAQCEFWSRKAPVEL